LKLDPGTVAKYYDMSEQESSIYRKESVVGREERLVNDKCRISVDASHYTLPAEDLLTNIKYTILIF